MIYGCCACFNHFTPNGIIRCLPKIRELPNPTSTELKDSQYHHRSPFKFETLLEIYLLTVSECSVSQLPPPPQH